MNILAGQAFVSGACKRYISTVLARDVGGFEGIINVAHELGHMQVFKYVYVSNVGNLNNSGTIIIIFWLFQIWLLS